MASTPSPGQLNQSLCDQLNAKVGLLEDEIREYVRKDAAKQIMINRLQSQLDEAQSAKNQLSGQLNESIETSKLLKEGKQELLLAVVNLNERLEAQSRMTAEAQTVFSKLPAAIRALKRLDDETVKLRQDNADHEIETENLRRVIADLKENNDEKLEELAVLRSELESQLSSFKDVKHTLERAVSYSEGNATSLSNQLEESKQARNKDKLIFKSERLALQQDAEKLRDQLATRSLILTMKAPKAKIGDDAVELPGETKDTLLHLVDDLKYNLFRSEANRKKLFNQLQELRGNVRVYVRCRPYINYDGDDSMALENVSVNNDSIVCGSVRFYKDGSSIALAGCVNVRDKPQVNHHSAVLCTNLYAEDTSASH